MGVKLKDPGSVQAAMAEVIGEIALETVLEAAFVAQREANRLFAEAPPPGASMDEWNMQPIIDSARSEVVQRESPGKLGRGDVVVLEWTHPHVGHIEWGVVPHEIEGDPVLAWEDRETGETVFRTRVEHPGIPAVGAIRAGVRKAFREMGLV